MPTNGTIVVVAAAVAEVAAVLAASLVHPFELTSHRIIREVAGKVAAAAVVCVC